MRDAFGEVYPDEIDVIDLVEPDASAFAERGESAPPTGRGYRRRWLVPAAIASAVGLVAAGLMVWSPWRTDDSRSYPKSDAPESTLAQELVVYDVTSTEFVPLYSDVDAETGDTFLFTVSFNEGRLLMCIEKQSDDGPRGTCDDEPRSHELPILWAGNREGHRLVLAIIERGLRADGELRVTLADGTIETFPLVDHGVDLPGPAVATVLPVGHGAVELWVGEIIVATL